jgi:RNA polymerase sigma-70 factor (ECF subfamily)
LEPHASNEPPQLVSDDASLTRDLLGDMAGLQAQLLRVVRDPQLAADLLQDAIVTALQKLRAGQINNRAALDGFVYRVALNHLRNHRRKDKSHLADKDGADNLPEPRRHGQPVESLDSHQWARVVHDLLDEISSQRDRELLVRFYLHEESKDQLCRQFGLTDLHFNRVICRARDRFRELLERRGLRKSDFLSLAAILLAAC